MAILTELYIKVAEGHQHYRYMLARGQLDGKQEYYTCKHWHPSSDYLDIEVSTMHKDVWLLICWDCYNFDWDALLKVNE